VAAVFDGSATVLSRSATLARLAGSKKVTVAGWGRLESDAASAAHYILYGASVSNVRLAVYTDSSHKLVVSGYNSSNTEILHLITTNALTLAAWFHFVASADLSAGTGHFYINGSDDQATGSTTLTDDTIAFGANANAWYVGAAVNTTYWDGRLYDLGLWREYVDVSDADNLAGFISSDGVTDTSYTPDATHLNPGPTAGTRKPVGYGAFASAPTSGTRPAIFFSGGFTSNRGTGGPFALNGTIDQETGPDIYRQSALYATPGKRWFDSERSGFSYPRSKTFIERREGHPNFGARMGVDERDEKGRHERPSHTFARLLFHDDVEARESEDRR
jgi:hypothetical protein